MKNCRTLFLVMALSALWTGTAFAQNDGTKGNGLPQSKLLYNLEVIAYDGDHCPSGDQIGSNGHRIAVRADVSDDPKGLNPNTLIRQNDYAGPRTLHRNGWQRLQGRRSYFSTAPESLRRTDK